MSKGLTYDPNSLKVNSKSVTDDIFETNVYNTAENGITTITLEFKDSYIADNVGQTITLTYSATLNKDAVIDGDGNTNKAVLSYGNNKTVESQTTTKSLQFDLIKVDGADNKLLDGAQFKLYTAQTGGDPIKVVSVGDNYRVAKGNEEGATDTITVTNGKVRISGLDKTTYWLEETKAPDGYNQLTDRQMVDLSKGSNNTTLATGATTWNDNGGVVVRNNAGATLPSTGGMGTTLFYVIGGGLMVAAAVLLITKKRMERKN